MLGIQDPGLQVSRYNHTEMQAYAERLEQPYPYFVNASVELGVGLGELVEDMAPEQLRIAFRTEGSGRHKVYDLDFGEDKKQPEVEPELAHLEAQFHGDRELLPVPLDQEMLVNMTRMAYRLSVERREFFASSIFFYYQWALTERNRSQTYIGLPGGGFKPI